jgi:hypothetical protein
MSKPLKNHHDWVEYQFKKYLRDEYRDAFIHSSLIEGVLVKESGMDKFDLANKFLLCSGKITSFEFCIFNEIREIRNKIAHEIFKKQLKEKDINKLRDDLMSKIKEAYRKSSFLNIKLLKKYSIERKDVIKFEPENKP